MARTLSERDIGILKKLAPEVEDLICAGSGVEYRSILPPVSRHYSEDEADFAARLERLSADDLRYLVGAIEDGSESLGCMPPEDVESFAKVVAEKLSADDAKRVVAAYEGAECDS
jgi:hypothetical protein